MTTFTMQALSRGCENMEKYLNELKNHIESLTHPNRMNMIFYCVGYYGSVDSDCLEAINELYAQGLIEF